MARQMDGSVITLRYQNVLTVVCSSSNLIDFLIKKGAVFGDKIAHKINIPDWIKGNYEYEKAFVRGMVDTDGCLFIYKHITKGVRCNNLGLCFTSYSVDLTKNVANILKKSGIDSHFADRGRRVYLYSAKSVLRYLQNFGSSNPRILNKYKEWIDLQRGQGRNIDNFPITL